MYYLALIMTIPSTKLGIGILSVKNQRKHRKAPKQRRERRRENGEEEEILICNINLVSLLQGMIEAYIGAYNH
jgi:hypothetical protein